MVLKHKHLVWIIALFIGLSVDWLFWEKPGGINFFILVFASVIGGLIPAWLNKIHIPLASYLLIIPITFFSAMTFIRSEPFTTVINILITISLLILFSMTLRTGAWVKFNFIDHLTALFRFFGNAFTGGILFFTRIKNRPTANQSKPTPDVAEQRNFLYQASPYLRGILLALPILVVLTALLASADPVFNLRLQNLLQGFELPNIGEYLFRLFYILVIGYLLLSAYYFGLAESEKLQASSPEKNKFAQILGWIEANIILGGINLLFLAFVSLQFTYLFGGETNIHLEGFTYAEYARRGFFELLAVALFTLMVYYALSIITRRESIINQRVFSASGLLLVGLVSIILISAYTRLTLYEAAYGFTRLRTLTHIFILWVGLLLAAVALLEILGNFNRMALTLIVFILGFGLSVNLVNVDNLITRHNIARSLLPGDETISTTLDAGYLYSLSWDSIPPLVTSFTNPETPEPIQQEIGGVLACRLFEAAPEQRHPWTSWHYTRSRAIELLNQQSSALEAFPIIESEGIFVEVSGEQRLCSPFMTSIVD